MSSPLTYPLDVYVDMDGVVADFDKRVTNALGMDGRTYEKETGKTVWDYIISHHLEHGDFFGTLDLTPEAEELWHTLCSLHFEGVIHVRFLTSAGYGDYAEDFRRQKREFIDFHFGNAWEVICTESGTGKNVYAHQDALLIDDTMKNLVAFEEAGGAIIHHRGNAHTTLVVLLRWIVEKQNEFIGNIGDAYDRLAYRYASIPTSDNP